MVKRRAKQAAKDDVLHAQAAEKAARALVAAKARELRETRRRVQEMESRRYARCHRRGGAAATATTTAANDDDEGKVRDSSIAYPPRPHLHTCTCPGGSACATAATSGGFTPRTVTTCT